MKIICTSPKREKHQNNHYILSLTFTTLGQQSMAVTTEKLAVNVGKNYCLLSSLEGQFQIFTLNSNVKFPTQVSQASNT